MTGTATENGTRTGVRLVPLDVGGLPMGFIPEMNHTRNGKELSRPGAARTEGVDVRSGKGTAAKIT